MDVLRKDTNKHMTTTTRTAFKAADAAYAAADDAAKATDAAVKRRAAAFAAYKAAS